MFSKIIDFLKRIRPGKVYRFVAKKGGTLLLVGSRFRILLDKTSHDAAVSPTNKVVGACLSTEDDYPQIDIGSCEKTSKSK